MWMFQFLQMSTLPLWHGQQQVQKTFRQFNNKIRTGERENIPFKELNLAKKEAYKKINDMGMISKVNFIEKTKKVIIYSRIFQYV